MRLYWGATMPPSDKFLDNTRDTMLAYISGIILYLTLKFKGKLWATLPLISFTYYISCILK